MTLTKKLKSSVCAVTHAGNVRTDNEDNFVLNGRTTANGELKKGSAYIQNMYEPFYLSVCDGMGGETCGELASSIACNTLVSYAHSILDAGDNFSRPLADCLREANRLICDEIVKKGERIGTTVASCYAVKGKLICVNIGDSRIYRFSNGILEQLSVDHTHSQAVVDSGAANEINKGNIAYGGKLTRHLGIFPDEAPLSPSVCAVDDIEDGDIVIICSDGLTNLVTDDQIRMIAFQSNNSQEVASRLVKAALRNGGTDNITVIAAFMKVEQAAGFAPIAAQVVGSGDADYYEEYQSNFGKEADKNAGLFNDEEETQSFAAYSGEKEKKLSPLKIAIIAAAIVLAIALVCAAVFGIKAIIKKATEDEKLTTPNSGKYDIVPSESTAVSKIETLVSETETETSTDETLVTVETEEDTEEEYEEEEYTYSRTTQSYSKTTVEETEAPEPTEQEDDTTENTEENNEDEPTEPEENADSGNEDSEAEG